MIAAAPRNLIETDLAVYQRCCLHHYSHMTAGVALPAIAILAAVALVVALLHRNQVTRAFKAETALRASREVLSLAMRGGRMGAWSRDIVTNKVWWSPELEEIFGLPAGGLEGSDAAFFAYVHEDDRPAVAHAIETTLATGNDYVIEFRIRDATGEWRWIEGRGKPSYGEDRRIVTLHGVCIDITAHKAVEQSLRQSEERYHTLFESIDEGFCIIEVIFDATRKPVDYRFVEVNPAFVEHTGLTDALGKTMRELVPDHDAHWFETYGRVATSGKAERFVNEAKALGRWFDVYAAQTGPAGSNRVAVLFNNITARKQAENNLRALAGDLAETNRRKDEFLAVLAHELRNPLAPIRNAVEIMHLHGGLPQELGDLVGMVDRQVGHLTRLVDDLLEVSRIAGGKVELRKHQITLAAPLHDAVESVQPLMKAANHELSVDVPNGIYIDADKTRITQIFLNLLNNAAKFTPRGGRIHLSAAGDDERVVIRVRDNGIGIPHERLEHVFDMFSQLSAPLEGPDGGLGIGLALVRGLVELHGGSVEALSAGLEQGSELIVRLPRVQAPADEARSNVEASVSVDTKTRKRVLVVDDNRDAASSLRSLIEMLGHEVREVYNGADALDITRSFDPELIFLDIGMPKLNGYDAAREIRRISRSDSVPTLIAVTGWGQPDDKRRSKEAGFDMHVTKPVPLATLESLLDHRAEAA